MKTAVEPAEALSWNAQGMPQTGVIAGLSPDGRPLVDYTGNEFGPIPARTVISMANPGDSVLLFFEQRDLTRPIIVGIVRERFEDRLPTQVKIAARQILVEGTEQVSISCGEASLTLRKDGRATLKGKEIVSRASRTNRVRGATVKIN